MKEKIIENKGEKYSEMLYKVVEEFDKELPVELSFENTLEIGIEAWNLANKKEFLPCTACYLIHFLGNAAYLFWKFKKNSH